VTGPGCCCGEQMTKQKQNKKQKDRVVDPGLRFDEKLVAPFEPDILASADYERVYQKRLLSAEHQLMLAVLQEAIADFQKYVITRDYKGKKRFTEAEAWILDKDTGWIFSLVSICEVFGFDPDYLRQGLRRWKQARLAQKRNALIAPRRRPEKGRILSAA